MDSNVFSEKPSCSNYKLDTAEKITREDDVVDFDTSLTAVNVTNGDESKSVFTRQFSVKKNTSIGCNETHIHDEIGCLGVIVHTENKVSLITKDEKSSKTYTRKPMPIQFNKDFFKSEIWQVVQHFINNRAHEYMFHVSKKVILSKFCFEQFLESHIMPLTIGYIYIETPFLRISSFRLWPSSSTISANSLSDAGFCCENADTETVKCSSCNLTFQVSELHEMGPLEYHINKSPNCIYSIVNAPRSRSRSPNTEETTSNDTTTRFRSSRHEMNYPINIPLAPDTQAIGSPFTDVIGMLPSSENSSSNETADGVPIQEYKDYCTRLETFRYFSLNDKPAFEDLAQAGFYYTGDEDTVCCFQCDIGIYNWNQQNDPWVEHARHRSDCPFLLSNRSYIPRHVKMIQYSARIQTFNFPWPRNIPQTPEMFANAGFFYTGEEYIVRCHHCDGRLREWEPQDDPWTEHARWFPFCKFVIRTKGIGFAKNAATTDEPRGQQHHEA